MPRPRLTIEEKLARLEAEKAAIMASREQSAKKNAAALVADLRALADSPVESLGPIREEARGLAARVERWLGQ